MAGPAAFTSKKRLFAAHLTERLLMAHMFPMNGLLAICIICEITS